MAEASTASFFQKPISEYEANLGSIIENATKYGLLPSQDEILVNKNHSDQSEDTDSFAKYLTACTTLVHQGRQFMEKALDLHNRSLCSSTHHLMDNAILENRIGILQKIDSHLKSIMDNKDYLLDQLNASPSQTTNLSIHTSHQESVLETFASLSNWMKNLEANLQNTGDRCASDVENDLDDVTRSTEALLARMNADIRLIKCLQGSVHNLSQLKMNDDYDVLKTFY